MQNRKTDSKTYYDRCHGNILARADYWKHDYTHIIDVIRKEKPTAPMDIGCGTGAFLQYVSLADLNIRLSGLDVSEGMLQKAKGRLPECVTVYQDDAE